ncbi:MAG TPA: hypothetical protein VM925_03070 [Labilithrix sp.]|nr:hypothetical protein [Labilithrix sp.]
MADGHTMRHGTRASTTAFLGIATAALCVASCVRPTRRLPAAEPPARALAVTDGRISLRASAYVELHLRLAAASRTEEDVGPELEPAKQAYARSLHNDDEDGLLGRITRALSACEDDRCASAAVSAEGFGTAYDRVLPGFVARSWLGRASTAWSGIEGARAAMEAVPSVDVLFARAAGAVGARWPEHPVIVDIVSEAPPVGRSALAPTALASRGRCFVREQREDERVNHARILDCLLVHALLALQVEDRGPLHDVLVRELGARDGDRAWTLLVVHAVATTVAGLERRHRSVYRRSAGVVEPVILDWLVREWPRAEDGLEAFGLRFVTQWREGHPAPE